jgi:hypothetical protein
MKKPQAPWLATKPSPKTKAKSKALAGANRQGRALATRALGQQSFGPQLKKG